MALWVAGIRSCGEYLGSFLRAQIVEDPLQGRHGVRVAKVARVRIRFWFTVLALPTQRFDHALELLDLGHAPSLPSGRAPEQQPHMPQGARG